MIVTGICVLVLLLMAGAYVRFAPADPDRWHQRADPKPVGDYPRSNGFEAVRAVDRSAEEVLTEADAVILATPRTRRIAGSVAEGMLTYQSRSQVWGFPDYTTVWVEDGTPPLLRVHARARFGGYDWGVNAKRVRGWLDELGLGS